MWLRLEGIVDAGVSILDEGITDFEVAVIDGVVHLYALSGANGGLTEYVVGANGQVTLHSRVIFPDSITTAVEDRMVLVEGPDGPMLLIGGRASGLFGYDLAENGGLGPQASSGWGTIDAAIAGGSYDYLAALIELSDHAGSSFPGGFDSTQIVSVAEAQAGGRDYVLVADAEGNSVTAYRFNASTGRLVEVSTMGAEQGLGIDAPTAMEVVTVNGHSFVILASANTSTLSVLQLGDDGSLVPTDHVIDNGGTRFEGVQALAVTEVDGHVFIVAGGADSGITLFTLMPDGTLVALQTLADEGDTAMHSVAAIDIAVSGETLYVFVSSQHEGGITTFTLDLGDLGEIIDGTAAAERLLGTARSDVLMAVGANDTLIGGSGDDVLVSGGNGTVMAGGDGGDTFVIRDDAGATTISDFQPGEDRLDLSDLPMLRDPSQLTFTPTATGAVLEYRGQVILITSANGQSLRLQDIFPDGFDWGDHIPYIPPEDEEPANRGIQRIGSAVNDSFTGTARDDTLSGGGGRDTLTGGGGNDELDGGDGNDLLRVSGGDNTLRGGAGDDRVLGGGGQDWLEGGSGNDKLKGGAGADTLHGGEGRDSLLGGGGHDLMIDDGDSNLFRGGGGDDTMRGGIGNDTMRGGAGNDLADGGDGNDLLSGGRGNDTLQGGGGNDTLSGQGGRNLLDGGSGNDRLIGGAAADTLLGGDGNDTIEGGGGDDRADGGTGDDRLNGAEGNDDLDGSTGNDALWGDVGNDTLRGGWGNDWMSGGEGDDVLSGGPGNDTMRGGSGNDVFWGGAGADVFEFFRDHDQGRVMDFNPTEGDLIRLDDWIWFSLGDLTADQVVERFGSVDANGNVVLDFSDVGGNVVTLDGYSDLDALPNYIEII